jgi:PHP family Zn ribbon phosphoesterase
MKGDDIQVTCRVCQRKAKAKEMVLDPVFKQMACPACVRDRKNSEAVKKELADTKQAKAPPKPEKPSDWDADDDFLEKTARKAPAPVPVVPVSGDKVKVTCSKCKYQITYNTLKGTPVNCPFCGTPIPKKMLGL